MTQATDSTATATLSGRELALNRRKAMALHGKAGVMKATAKSSKPSSQRMNPPASASVAANNAQAAIPAAASGRSASRARREAMNTVGKAALKPSAAHPSGRMRPKDAQAVVMATAAKSCGCGCNGTKTSCDPQPESNVMPAAAQSSYAVAAAKVGQPTGRALARARRAALSQDGKSGLKRVAQATKIAATMPGQDWQAAITKGVTGRQKAMQHRVVQSLAGETDRKSVV